MATEASLTDKLPEAAAANQKILQPVEEEKVTDFAEKNTSHSAETEVKDDEKELKKDNSLNLETSLTELKGKTEEVSKETGPVDGSEKVADPKIEFAPALEPAVEGVEKKLTETLEASDVPKPPSEAVEQTKALEAEPAQEESAAVEVHEKELQEAAGASDVPEPQSKAVAEPQSEAIAQEAKDSEVNPVQEEYEAAKESAVEVNSKELKEKLEVADVLEPPSAAVEQPTKDLEATAPVQKESEAAIEPSVPEPAKSEEQKIEPPAHSEIAEARESAAITEEEKISVEASPEPPQEEPSSKEIELKDETSKVQENVASESLDTAAADASGSNETKEIAEGATIVQSNVSVVEEVVKEVTPDAGLATESKEVVETIVDSAVTKKEAEKPAEVEGPKLSEPTKEDASVGVADIASETEKVSEDVEVTGAKKDEILGGQKPSIDETSRDVSVATEVAEAPSKAEKVSGGADTSDEEKNESSQGEKPASVETSRDLEVVGEKTNTEAVAKGPEEAAQIAVDSSKDNKEEGEKADRGLVETIKDSTDSKTVGEAPKQEAPAKSAHRQSNNLISKMKHSMVKVKKAIMGKSPSSKTISTEGKDDIKV